MKKLISLSLLALIAQAASASVIIQYDFNDAAGTELGPGFGRTEPTIGTATWGTSIPTSTTNGSGQLVNTGNFSQTTALFSGFTPVRADSGTYELAYKGVSFNNLGADDFLVFGFFSSNSGSPTPGITGASSSSRSFLKFGNFNGADGIDFAYGPNRDTINTAFNQGSLASTYDLFIELDTDAKSVSFFYSADGGTRTQIGSTITGIPIGTNDGSTGGAADASYRALVLNGRIATGASISVDQIQFSAIPEPSTYALIGGLLVAGIALLRRRR